MNCHERKVFGGPERCHSLPKLSSNRRKPSACTGGRAGFDRTRDCYELLFVVGAAQAKAILKEDKQTIFDRVHGSLVYLESGGYNTLLYKPYVYVGTCC